MKKIFLISPVRQATDEIMEKVEAYVKKKEREGYEVHWPIRDTNQVDPSGGINICDTNLSKMFDADEIHLWYLMSSSGIHFDMGGVYMMLRILGKKKKFFFVNSKEFDEEAKKSKKSFIQVFRALEKITMEENNEEL